MFGYARLLGSAALSISQIWGYLTFVRRRWIKITNTITNKTPETIRIIVVVSIAAYLPLRKSYMCFPNLAKTGSHNRRSVSYPLPAPMFWGRAAAAAFMARRRWVQYTTPC